MTPLRHVFIAMVLFISLGVTFLTLRTSSSMNSFKFFESINETLIIQTLESENRILVAKLEQITKKLEAKQKELDRISQVNTNHSAMFPIKELVPRITNRNAPRLAVVLPFVASQLDLMIRALLQWGVTRIKACDTENKGDYSEFRSLVFYYDQDLSTKEDLKSYVVDQIDNMSWISQCFNSVSFESAGLTEGQSVYAYGNYLGPNLQWMRTFELPIMKNADYWFLIEPDVVAIRDFWLDRVYEETAFAIDDFWMKGSTNRIPHYGSFHMNGNAIYKLHDADFKATVLDPVATRPDQPFDLMTMHYFYGQSTSNQAHYKEIQHKVVFADFVQDWSSGTELFPYNDILQRFPNTVLVHNKKAVLDWVDGKPPGRKKR